MFQCDKKNGIVNGQRATVKTIEHKSVFLQLPSGCVVSTHLVTCKKPDGTMKTTHTHSSLPMHSQFAKLKDRR